MRPRTKQLGIAIGVAAAAISVAGGDARADPAATSVAAELVAPTADDGGGGGPLESCALESAHVAREIATFTVGPEGCEGEVGPISFSAFFLPGGLREPYEDQVLIAHHPANGSSYGPGSYELTIAMGTPCNWQTDLYVGVNEMPKFRYLVAYDYDEREVCDGEPTTTTTTTTTTTPTTTTTLDDDSAGPTTTTLDDDSAGPTTTLDDDSAGPTTTTLDDDTGPTTTLDDDTGRTTTTTAEVGSGGPTTVLVDDDATTTTTTRAASAGPAPGQGGGTLPSTGSSRAADLAVLAGMFVGAGAIVRRMARL